MSTDRWRRIEALYHSARERTPEDRSAYLEHACGGDEPLRGEVESLLAQEERAVKFLETDEPGGLEPSIAASVGAGEQIGPYLVLDFIQKGGMGEVYKARDIRLDRTVAIKFLPRAVAGAPDALERFQREVRAASALNHPRICTVHDVGEHQGRPFYVMEFLDGQSLRDVIADKPLAIPEVVDLGMQICDALQAAHAKGIIHRDIKPANIFVTASGQIKILDFGIAKLVTKPHPSAAVTTTDQTTATVTGIATTRPGRLMGTLAYLSPEQARGEEVDTRTDIFSLGVVLYQMATGELAFRGETPDELIDAILHQAPLKPSELNPSVPAILERIILRALEKDRSARYQSIEALFADLQELRQAKPRWFRTAPLLLVLVAALATATFTGIMVARRTHSNAGAPDLVQRQVTANPNNDSVYAAAISGDGKQLAYTDLEGVHVRLLSTGEVHSIPLPPGLCFR
jgi:eukaryotic-like serine/threonine-protein kinase